MWQLIWTEAFSRRCRKLLRRNRKLGDAVAATLALLAEHPHDPRLKLHPLRGELEGLWAVRVTYSVRLILALDEAKHEIVLLALGTHDEAYG
jgi:addiction module RelE/StbE family toxin